MGWPTTDISIADLVNCLIAVFGAVVAVRASRRTTSIDAAKSQQRLAHLLSNARALPPVPIHDPLPIDYLQAIGPQFGELGARARDIVDVVSAHYPEGATILEDLAQRCQQLQALSHAPLGSQEDEDKAVVALHSFYGALTALAYLARNQGEVVSGKVSAADVAIVTYFENLSIATQSYIRGILTRNSEQMREAIKELREARAEIRRLTQ